MSYIYAIYEKSTEHPIYVGSTSTSTDRRFRIHLRDCYSSKRNSSAPIHAYMRSKAPTVTDAKAQFYIQALTQCSESICPEWEDHYTKKLKNGGYALLNVIKPGKILQPIEFRNVPAVVDSNTLYCRRCGHTKPKELFHNKRSLTGKQSYCAECQITLMAQYRRQKVYKSLEKIPEQYVANPDAMPLSKFCPKCRKLLAIHKFYVCKTHKDGFQSYCKSCCKQHDKDKRATVKTQKLVAESINSASL